jgi:hypothetical protein
MSETVFRVAGRRLSTDVPVVRALVGLTTLGTPLVVVTASSRSHRTS